MIEEGVPRGGSVGGLVTYWFLLLKARPKATMIDVGEWRSMVARYVRDVEAPGSNPGSPTNNNYAIRSNKSNNSRQYV